MSGFAGHQRICPCLCFPECTCEVTHGSRTRNKLRWLLLLLDPDRVWSWATCAECCCSSAGPVSWLLHFTGGSGVDFPAELFSIRLKSSAQGNPNPQEPEGSKAPEVSRSGSCPSHLQNELGSIILPWWAAGTPCTFPSLIFTAWQLWLLGREAEAVPCAHTEKLRHVNEWLLQVGEVKFL